MTFWVAGATIVGGIASSVISSKAAGNAADTQARSADAATQAQKDALAQQRADQEPFRQGGLTAQSRLMQLLGLGDKSAGTSDQDYGSLMRNFGASDFQQDPGYQFRLQQGNQALDRSASARGGLLSGAAMKDAMNYNQGAASQEYSNAFNRFQTNRSNQLNPLQSLMGSAQSATNQVGNATQNTANQVGNNLMSAGNARASGYVGQANAWNQGIGQGVNYYQQNQLMNKMFPSGGGQGYYNGEPGSGAMTGASNFMGPVQ